MPFFHLELMRSLARLEVASPEYRTARIADIDLLRPRVDGIAASG